MTDITTRRIGKAGRITLNRPKALNAVTHDMCREVEGALEVWRDDDAVGVIIMDAAGEKAFSAGGDIAALYDSGIRGDFAFGQAFWRDEYRLNAKLREYPKPIISFLHGLVLGGGVGLGCHGSHRIVGETSKISMPECLIGLVPDVGGSMMLANAPGWTGLYAGLTGTRLKAGDAIALGFADLFIPEADWPALIETLEATGDVTCLTAAAQPAPEGPVMAARSDIDALFDAPTLPLLLARLRRAEGDLARAALQVIEGASPLALAYTIWMLHQLRGNRNLRDALQLEYRFTARAMEHGDFIEGIRAAIIDKDRSPRWKHDIDALPEQDLAIMQADLGALELTF
ncbi:enoyl-CoA hydratase/isomerase family protein [Aliiroseovarius crassostreae]|uniref:enoyl-CoA hydratase/isomerase family protein n=1 Tax=Aliiroseovarius crassostreae TaxID=154981 RepID=UPI002206AF5F|nr:enoyl-CoA hydratase/isomerase family protein [Aliiroseovarius crassostreae]UWP88098.1 enoyl-CoA hydratase/isomerase family protein [Aliiroseovarius crassostreae]UWQ00717.1 enoyl-CoA hydratase/isomerase family protein [Aliiroseovarius crassostreae]